MKTTKLNSGYYSFEYKGYSVIISKWEDPCSFKTMWYFKINDGDVDDLFKTKKIAIEAAIEVIDNPKLYNL